LRSIVLVVLVTGCASAPVEVSEWERQHEQKSAIEEALVLPPYPQGAKLIEFQISDPRGFRFFVDGATLSVGKDGIVRYTLVAQSPDGVRNVSYEGLRCVTAEHRLYALGRPDRSWSPSRTSWEPVRNARQWQVALYREYFCPQKLPPRDADEGVRALQAGGHPFSKGFAAPGGI
jgi:hypothetical protein